MMGSDCIRRSGAWRHYGGFTAESGKGRTVRRTFSNLDSLNEAMILKSIYEERKGKTVVLVSHRKSTMRIADQVYSVENHF